MVQIAGCDGAIPRDLRSSTPTPTKGTRGGSHLQSQVPSLLSQVSPRFRSSASAAPKIWRLDSSCSSFPFPYFGFFSSSPLFSKPFPFTALFCLYPFSFSFIVRYPLADILCFFFYPISFFLASWPYLVFFLPVSSSTSLFLLFCSILYHANGRVSPLHRAVPAML